MNEIVKRHKVATTWRTPEGRFFTTGNYVESGMPYDPGSVSIDGTHPTIAAAEFAWAEDEEATVANLD